MAIHRDFMMRMLERLSAAFLRFTLGKAQDDPEEVLFEIEELLAESLNTSREYALGAGPAAIETVHSAVAAELARLLFLHGKLSEKLGRLERAHRARVMAVRATQRALERPNTRFARLAAEQLRTHHDVIVALVDHAAWAQMCIQAHRCAVVEQKWTKAEDFAFFALEADRSHETEVRGFFEHLLEEPDTLIEAGGLSRAEVEQSLAQLRGDDG